MYRGFSLVLCFYYYSEACNTDFTLHTVGISNKWIIKEKKEEEKREDSEVSPVLGEILRSSKKLEQCLQECLNGSCHREPALQCSPQLH